MSTAPVSNESSAPASAAAAPPTQEQGTRPWALGPPIRVGDVGFVCDGVFCRLFSAALPEDHPAQRDLGVPRGFAPLPMPEHVLDMQANVPEDAAGRNEWAGALPVRPSSGYVGPMSVLAQALTDDPGPGGDAVRTYIRTNMTAWLEFAHSLNVGIAAEDILLVRGCYAPPGTVLPPTPPEPIKV